MGWLWTSSPEGRSTATHASDQDVFIPPPLSTDPPPPSPEPSASQADVVDHPLSSTREALADAELVAFLRELQSTSSTNPSPSPSSPSSSDPDSESCFSHMNKEPKIDPLSLYPTTMSCRAAFDSAFHCQSLGGQFISVYRYGNMRSCSDHWSHFWFCMRTNRGFMNEEERKRKIQTWYWEKDSKYRNGASSEDVWRPRSKRLERAFEGDFEALEREGKIKL